MANERAATGDSKFSWAGWLGIILGIIGLFFLPVWMGIGAIIFGIVALKSPGKGLAWGAIILGIIDLIVAFVFIGSLW